MAQKRQKLVSQRMKMHLSQGEVATMAGVDRTYYGRLENGHRDGDIETWYKIARALRWPLEKVSELIYDIR